MVVFLRHVGIALTRPGSGITKHTTVRILANTYKERAVFVGWLCRYSEEQGIITTQMLFFVVIFLFPFPSPNPLHISSHCSCGTLSSSYPLSYSEQNSSVPSLLSTTTSPSCSPHLSTPPLFYHILLLLHLLHITAQPHNRAFSAVNKYVLDMSTVNRKHEWTFVLTELKCRLTDTRQLSVKHIKIKSVTICKLVSKLYFPNNIILFQNHWTLHHHLSKHVKINCLHICKFTSRYKTYRWSCGHCVVAYWGRK